MSKRAERRRAYKRMVLRAVGKEYACAVALAKPKKVLYCSVCHGRLRLKLLPDYECRKCGRTYDMSEAPLPPEVTDDTQVVLSGLSNVGEGGSSPQVQEMPR